MPRPKVLTPQLKAEICDRISDGETVRQIAANEHMPTASTIYKALAEDETFSEQYARAREIQLQRWEDELLAIADDTHGPDVQNRKLMIDTRKWVMSKRAPKKYGDRVQQEIDLQQADGPAFGVVNIWSRNRSTEQ